MCHKLLTKGASSNPSDNASLTTLQIASPSPVVFHNFGLKAGQLQVLVATDVAARGLHVKHLLGNPGEIVDCTGLPGDTDVVKDIGHKDDSIDSWPFNEQKTFSLRFGQV